MNALLVLCDIDERIIGYARFEAGLNWKRALACYPEIRFQKRSGGKT